MRPNTLGQSRSSTVDCPRRGVSLVELLAALPLLALLTLVSVQLALSAHRHTLRADGAIAASRELRHAATVLASEVRPLRPRDLVAWADTAIEFEGAVGIGVVCAANGARHVLSLASDPAIPVGDSAVDLRAAMWMQPPQPGDAVHWFTATTAPLDTITAMRDEASDNVRSVNNGVGCATSPLALSPAGRSVELETTAAWTRLPLIGAPVRVTRRTRYSLYRGTDGDWYLGRRTRSGATWDVVQPVAGPLLSARQSGVRFEVFDRRARSITSAGTTDDTRPARLVILLRAPRRVGRAEWNRNELGPVSAVDSVIVELALRSASVPPP